MTNKIHSLSNPETSFFVFNHLYFNGLIDIPSLLICRRVCKYFDRIINALLDPTSTFSKVRTQYFEEIKELHQKRQVVLKKLTALVKEKKNRLDSMRPTFVGRNIIPIVTSIVSNLKDLELPSFQVSEKRELYLLNLQLKRKTASREYDQTKDAFEPIIHAVEKGCLSSINNLVCVNESARKLKCQDINFTQMVHAAGRASNREKELWQIFTEKVSLARIYHLFGGRFGFNALPEIKMDIDRITLDGLKGPITRGVDSLGRVYLVVRGKRLVDQRPLFQVFFQARASWTVSLQHGSLIDISSNIIEDGHALTKERMVPTLGFGAYSMARYQSVKGAFTQLEELLQNKRNHKCIVS